jgi:hypothetical protein
MNIHKLRDIGECQSHMLLINSSTRDRRQWPTSSEYSITFDRPFQNVVGYDILDASLPRNTYVVDTHNNLISFGVRIGGTDPVTTSSSYISSFSGCETMDTIMAPPVDVSAAQTTLKSSLKFVGSNYVFVNATKSFSSGYFVGFSRTSVIQNYNGVITGDPVLVSESVEIQFNAGVYEWRTLKRNVHIWRKVPIITISSVDYGVIKLSNGRNYISVLTDLINTPLSDQVYENSTSIEGKTVLQVSASYYNSLANYFHEFELFDIYIETGDHSISSLVSSITFSMPSNTLVLEGTSKVTPLDYSRKRKIAYRSSSYFFINMSRSNSRSVLGFSDSASVSRPTEYQKIVYGTHVFASVPEVSGVNSYVLYTPGVIDLRGPRLVKLRCPEIEEYRNQVNHGDVSPGIGVFGLDGSSLDYNNFRAAMTHPVAKLSRMTLRFENVDGSIYDFKGSEHHFLLTIRTIQPDNDFVRCG